MEELMQLNNLRGKWLFITILCGGLIGLIISIGSDLWGILFFLIFFMLLVFIGIKSHDKRFLNILLFAFFIRVLLSVLHTYGLWLPDSNADALHFELNGWVLAHNFSIDNLLSPQIRELYVKIIAFVYFFIGRVPLVIRLTNAFVGSLIVANVYYITKKLYGDRRSARIAALIATFFPTLILYSAITMREVSAIFFISLSILFLLKWISKKRFDLLIWSLAFFLTSVLFHGAMALFLPGYIIYLAYLLFKEENNRLLSLTMIILLAFILWKGYPLLMRKLPNLSLLLTQINYISKITIGASRGGAAYLKNLSVNSIFDIIYQTPIRMIYFLFAPFPWVFRKLIDLFGILDSICYILLVTFSINGIKKLWHKKKAFAFFLVFSFLIVWIGLSWGTSNFGTAIRHRTFLVWILIPVTSASLSKETKS